MPNWTDCTVKFTGPASDLIRMFNEFGAASNESSFYEDLSWENPKRNSPSQPLAAWKIIPYPEEWKDPNYQKNWSFATSSSSKDLPHHYTSVGYDWEHCHWGIKWGFCHWKETLEDVLNNPRIVQYKDSKRKISVKVHFAVPWSTPEILLNELGKKCPNIKIHCRGYFEDGGSCEFTVNGLIDHRPIHIDVDWALSYL